MFEYKVIPAPRKGARAKGIKGNDGRFANAMEATLNEMASDGWEYLRSESLPVDERQGLMRKRVEEYHNVLVFRRPVATATIAAEQDEHVVKPLFSAKDDPAVTRTDKAKSAGKAKSETEASGKPKEEKAEKSEPAIKKPSLKAEK